MQVEDSVLTPNSVASFDGGLAGGSRLGDESDASNNNALIFSYDEVFPALPDSGMNQHQINNANNSQIGQRNNKMRVTSTNVTQIVKVKAEERKYDENDSFGEKESVRTCKTITKDTNAIIEMTISKDQSLTFLIVGKPDNVVEARRKILAYFQTQASKNITIPKEYHKLVLGKLGQRLRDLEKETGTKINVPSMNDPSETITVTGTKEGIEQAINEIRTISEEQSKKASEKVSVSRMYLPFVCGPHNVDLNNLMVETGTKIKVIPVSPQKVELFIVGDKEGIAVAKDKVLKTVAEMEEKCSTVSVEVLRAQHKYVIGPKGSSIAEILEKTGVSVEMPTADTTCNTIILRGPQERLGIALMMVYEKANSVVSQVVEVPCWIHRYIIGKKGDDIKKLKEEFPKVQVEFLDKEDKIKIEGPQEEVKIIKEKIMSKANELISQMSRTSLTVDPKYYKHIIGKNGANVNRLKEQTDAMITISGTESNVIHIQGNSQGVSEAKRELEEMIAKLENEVEEEVAIEHKYHSSIIGQKGEKIREINNMFNQEVQITFPNATEKKDIVKVRGPKEVVHKCCKYLKNIVRELAENRYTIEVPIYKQYHKNVIGKGGSNVRKIKEETHTKIDLPAEGVNSDVIIITGKKENVEEARDRILKIQNEQANIVSEEMTLAKAAILSKNGRMMIISIANDCNGVKIQLPQPNGQSDKVTLKGPKEDVDRAKLQLQELATTEWQQNSYSAEVRVKPQHLKFLIGKNGGNIKKLRESTGCHFVFPTEKNDDKEFITIVGKEASVKQAKEELEASIKEIDNIVEEDVSVDPKYHKQFWARRSNGSILQRIIDSCSGISISFPRQAGSSQVTLRGSRQCVEMAKQRILEVVGDLENQVTIECVIPNQHHRSLTGPKHIKAQELCATYNVEIKFPERVNPDDAYSHQNNDYENNIQETEQINGDIYMNGDSQRPLTSDIIYITGREEQCQLAKQALLDSVPVTETIDVPFDYHRGIIGQKGQTIRELSTRFDVHINVPQSSEHLDTITVTGSKANIKLAKEAIQDKMADIDADNEDRKLKSYEVKLEVPAEYFPKIIGKRGAIINKIRDDHGVQINLPPRNSEDESTITIVGYQDKAEKAAEVIMKIVNELNSMVKEEVLLDARIHSRLIGKWGRRIRKVMDQFHVEIKFARPSDPNPDAVIIMGTEDNVADAKDHLLELQEEYMIDLDYETEYRPQKPDKYEDANPFANLAPRNGNAGDNNSAPHSGFVVKGGPWDQKAPDTASTQEFPSFGNGAIHTPTQSAPWGPRR